MKRTSAKAVVLVCADVEWEAITDILKPSRIEPSPFGEWFGLEPGAGIGEVPIVRTGCGKIPAAAATQFALDRWAPRLLLNIGTCGGFEGAVGKREFLLVERTIVYDILERTGRNEEQTARFATDIDLGWIRDPCPLSRARRAVIATADQDLSPESIPFLQSHGAVAADWESGAIAWVAARAPSRTRCLILRGVSDVVQVGGKPTPEPVILRGGQRVMRRLANALPELLAWALQPHA